MARREKGREKRCSNPGYFKKAKETKLEKSLEMLCDSFKEATKMEMQQQ